MCRELAAKNPRCGSVFFDKMTLIKTDGPPTDDDVVLYEDKDEHLHAETPASDTLSIHMKLQLVIERTGLNKLDHTVELKEYDIFDKEFIQDPRSNMTTKFICIHWK